MSLGLGLALVASPSRAAKQLGIGERPTLGRLLGGASLGAFPRSRAPLGLTTATGFAVLCFVLARRLDR